MIFRVQINLTAPTGSVSVELGSRTIRDLKTKNSCIQGRMNVTWIDAMTRRCQKPEKRRNADRSQFSLLTFLSRFHSFGHANSIC